MRHHYQKTPQEKRLTLMSDLMTQAMTRILQEIIHCPHPWVQETALAEDTVITGWWVEEPQSSLLPADC